MSLTSAHAGYAYQDLLSAYFIIEVVLSENDSIINIDQKEINDDRFDDLIIRNKEGIYRKQIKYSDSVSNSHTLSKEDLANDSGYNLALHSLFNSWKNYSKEERGELHLCLAWNPPTKEDKINKVLIEQNSNFSFSNHSSKIYCLNLNALWKKGSKPLKDWRKFRSEAENIERSEFKDFVDALKIEVNLPKASLNFYSPGELEKELLEKVKLLGVGEYPNKNLRPQEVCLALTDIVKKSRSRGESISSKILLKQLGIRTDFGRIEQNFPVISSKLIKTQPAIKKVRLALKTKNKLIITGEPGSGKSWFINNLEKVLDKKYVFVKHYCYTDLKDDLQNERIKLNTFYGNIIAEILDYFPELKNIKKQRWASNLNELNLLISHIPKEVIILVDGLDHINRIYELKKNVIKKAETEIISAIDNIIVPPDKVKFLILSQPIQELNKFNGFSKISLPIWTKKEVDNYLKTNQLNDSKLDDDTTISSFLTQKSNGNPLYLSYLIEEIRGVKNITLEHLETLPDYSYNLSEYYNYLLTKLNEYSQVPKILSGANFSLSKKDLVEITKNGDYVEQDLNSLSPILKFNYSTGGYSIYHESFRRFIIERLKSNKVEIWTNIFYPIAKWLKKKGFFSFNKASQFLFPLLFDNNKKKALQKFITHDYVNKCLYYGHSWELIVRNFKFLVASISGLKSFKKIILLSEQSRILASVEDDYEYKYEEYFKALGAVHGFDIAVNSLTLEGEPTLKKILGLNACYICEYNNTLAPWETYYKSNKKGENIPSEEFKFYLLYLLSNKNYNGLEHIAKQLKPKPNYHSPFIEEVKKWVKQKGDVSWINQTPITKKIVFPKIRGISKSKLFELRDSIAEDKYFREEEINEVHHFFQGVEYFIHENQFDFYEELVKPFRVKNWFRNWLIYFTKIKVLKWKKEYSYDEVKQTFNILLLDTEVFKGKPSTSNLHFLETIIHQSIVEGIQCVSDENNLKEIFEILSDVSDKTTTTIQNHPSGPIIQNDLLQIINEYDSQNIIDDTIKHIEETLESEKPFRFYQILSEYPFRLATLYSKKGEIKKAKKAFKKGIKYLLSYTHRKDSTLGELLNSIESLNNNSSILGTKYIRKLKVLSDTVVNHTDGKGTKWFPVTWFEKYLQINEREAALYLTQELSQYRYHWILEENLISLLIQLNGSVCPYTELFLCRTFPIESRESFIKNSIDLIDKVNEVDPDLGEINLKLFLSKLHIDSKRSYSEKFTNKTEKILNVYNLPNSHSKKSSQRSYYRDNISQRLEEDFSIRKKSFSDMSEDEFISYLERRAIPEKDSMGIFFRIEEIKSKKHKEEVIDLLTQKDRYLSDKKHQWINSIFQNAHEDVKVYYYLSKFTHQNGDYMETFANIEFFQKAYELNPKLTVKHLVEFVSKLIPGAYFTNNLSANIINALASVDYPKKKIVNLWKLLYNVINQRLSAKEKFDWKKALPKDLRKFSDKELLIAILLTRFKSNSSERHHWVITGLSKLIDLDSKSVIKPLKWFLSNSKDYLEICLLSVLQQLYEFHKNNPSYVNNFQHELNSIYPTNFFLIDWIIEQLLNLKRRERLIEQTIIYHAPSIAIKEFKNLNDRNYNLNRFGFDLDNIVGEFYSTFNREHKDRMDIFCNSLNKTIVKNVYPPNYTLRLINQRFYNQFRAFENIHGKEIYSLLSLPNKMLITQLSSTSNRPADIPDLIDLDEEDKMTTSLPSTNGWVRLGLYEKVTHSESFGKNIKVFKTFQGIVFTDKEHLEYPFSSYKLILETYWNDKLLNTHLDGFTTLFELQNDEYESLKLLWLHPLLFSKLDLKICNYQNGLKATNGKGEIVLRYNAWMLGYNGDMLHDELPKKNGAELLIRQDYFEKICNTYNNINPKNFSIIIK